MRIDLNCDLGEGFGAYAFGHDAELLDYVTSANIACGFHAGDPSTMRSTVQLAIEKGVAIGAHPGLPDLVGFGRRIMQVSPAEVYDLTLYQIGALQAFAQAEGAKISHVKPHGALYNMAARDHVLARSIAEAVRSFDPALALVGLAGSALLAAAEAAGLRPIVEAFPERSYEADGHLTPRDQPNALIRDHTLAAERAFHIVTHGGVISRQGVEIPLKADTLCIHGDAPGGLQLAQAIRQRFAHAKIDVLPFAKKS